MDKKLARKPHERSTHYSSSLVSKMRNASTLNYCPDAGSKHRLEMYQKNLCCTRYNDVTGGFDDQLYELLMKYAYDQHYIEDIRQYLDGLKDEDGYRFSRSIKVYSDSEAAMARFIEPNYSPFRWNKNYQSALEDLKSYFRRFKLRPISYSSDDDIRNFLPKTDTHSGSYYLLTGNRSKGDNMEGIFKTFSQAKRKALEVGSFQQPVLISFRTQASGEFNDLTGDKTNDFSRKLRVVSMISLLSIVNEMQFSVPFQRLMANWNKYAGGKNDHDIMSRLWYLRGTYDYYVSIDYSAFDQTISAWLLEDAFSIIRECFILDDEEESLFNIMVQDLIHKDFILSEGVLHSDRGLPSGSMFTNIIDSIVNALVITTYLYSNHLKGDMITMGDDNIIYTKEKIDLSNLETYIRKNFGMDVSAKKSSEGTKYDDPEFLSRFWTKGGVWRQPNIVLSRMMFPERFRRYKDPNIDCTPEEVLYAYILTYPLGMYKILCVGDFLRDNPNLRSGNILERVDSRYVPGILAYTREYLAA